VCCEHTFATGHEELTEGLFCVQHTNMAKAALNMMTRTCAEELAEHDIYMNSVDTGNLTP